MKAFRFDMLSGRWWDCGSPSTGSVREEITVGQSSESISISSASAVSQQAGYVENTVSQW